MSKFYKADDVIAFLNLHCPKDMWEYQIADLPTIDIVRCGECENVGTEDCPMDEVYRDASVAGE